MAVEPDLQSEIYTEFDVRVVDNEERYFCLLAPCMDKNKSLSNRQHWITHRKFVHKEKDNINLPSGRVIRKWLTERQGYQPIGRVAMAAERRMITAPSIVEGNTKACTLMHQISQLMTQLGMAWQELARNIEETSHTMPHVIPHLVAEKIRELYLSIERGSAVGAEIPERKKAEEAKGRKRRRKNREDEDTAEWQSLGKALAAGIQLPKQPKALDDRGGQSMYHTGPHETDHSMEEGVVEDGHEIHAIKTRVGDGGWGLSGLGQGLRPAGAVLTDVDRGDSGMGVGVSLDINDMAARMEDMVPALGVGVG